MKKQELRRSSQHLLKSGSRETRDEIECLQQRHLFESKLWQQARIIGTTMSQGFEWDTKNIIHRGWDEGKYMALPKCSPKDKRMQFYQIDHFDQLETVYFGLREPDPSKTTYVRQEEIDLLLVPGLLFNSRGYRLGFGGGFYDRFLSTYDGVTMMIASEAQRNEEIPVEAFDLPVQYILTEKGIQRTDGR
ncbi:5-formyltetrahydrofolate cyclo-ligase [Halobacillus litoralis]|uniref:5-formyltetrahydrofolate cyclo-ligase n=1 Tax=Halobacillus litoralis TaxID=45668 RepID=UPI001CD76339|nr:5-formyltetrahydrofolate cyclo-ligase [Halobacillus litoralis]MCA0970080.1 5-formyltetrahydrofolate cyclo-ligase [Halobacillus litoralis]